MKACPSPNSQESQTVAQRDGLLLIDMEADAQIAIHSSSLPGPSEYSSGLNEYSAEPVLLSGCRKAVFQLFPRITQLLLLSLGHGLFVSVLAPLIGPSGI